MDNLMNAPLSQRDLAEQHLREAAKEFQKCMQCGKCRSVCPVFKEFGNELFVARGKNKIAQKIVSGEFGAKIKSLLDSRKIQMVVYKEPEKTVKSVIYMLNSYETNL